MGDGKVGVDELMEEVADLKEICHHQAKRLDKIEAENRRLRQHLGALSK